jgi:hypothetical protein
MSQTTHRMPGQGKITRELLDKRHYLQCKGRKILGQTTRELPGKGQTTRERPRMSQTTHRMPGQGKITRELLDKRHYLQCKGRKILGQTTRELPGKGQTTHELPGKRHYLQCKGQTTQVRVRQPASVQATPRAAGQGSDIPWADTPHASRKESDNPRAEYGLEKSREILKKILRYYLCSLGIRDRILCSRR